VQILFNWHSGTRAPGGLHHSYIPLRNSSCIHVLCPPIDVATSLLRRRSRSNVASVPRRKSGSTSCEIPSMVKLQKVIQGIPKIRCSTLTAVSPLPWAAPPGNLVPQSWCSSRIRTTAEGASWRPDQAPTPYSSRTTEYTSPICTSLFCLPSPPPPSSLLLQ